MKSSKVLGTIFIIITTISYGLVPSLSILARGQGVAVETLLFNKFFYACIFMWLYIFIAKIPFKTDKRHFMFLIFIGISYIGLATTLYEAFKYISGSLATIISFTFPAMIIVVEMISGREKTTVRKITAVVVSMIGLFLIVWIPNISMNFKGIIFALGTAVFYVFYILGLSEERTKKMNSMAVAGYVLLLSAIFNFFRCWLSNKPFFTVSFDQFRYIMMLAVVCAFIAILTFCLGVKMIGPSNAAIINTFEPVVACAFGYLFVGDRLTVNMLIGGILVMIAVFIVNLPAKEKENQNIITNPEPES